MRFCHGSSRVATLLLVCVTGCENGVPSRDAGSEAGARPSGMLRAQGQSIVDDDGKPVALRGVAFGNAVWSDVELPTAHHSEVDFQRVQDMGMNLVRFYMNYKTFEDDSAPGVYKDSGFGWLDQNVTWAKAHGIRLQLNMHVPQGGFQSLGKGTALWDLPDNQDRLTALWTAIAQRYRDEPTILGYDLVNEPVVSGTKQQWIDLANRIVRAIRQVDPNHIITVERLNARGADGTGNADWSSDADLNFFTVDDENVMYEFHIYTPMEFTHQLASWVSCCQTPAAYPDPNAISVNWSTTTWKHWTWDGTPSAGALQVPNGSSPWTEYSMRYTVTDAAYKIGTPVFMSKNNSGAVYFDDFVVNEYDTKGTLVRQIEAADLEDAGDWYLWLDTSVAGAAGEKVQGVDGHAGTKSVGIKNTNTDASLSNNAFAFKTQLGYTYELKYWARADDSVAGSQTLGRLDFYDSSVPVRARDAAMLAAEVDRFAAWGNAHNVPLYLGEFGVIRYAFERGGLQWVSDMLDILAARNISWTYHSYHENAFGVYWVDYPAAAAPSNANQPLVDLFTTRLRD